MTRGADPPGTGTLPRVSTHLSAVTRWLPIYPWRADTNARGRYETRSLRMSPSGNYGDGRVPPWKYKRWLRRGNSVPVGPLGRLLSRSCTLRGGTPGPTLLGGGELDFDQPPSLLSPSQQKDEFVSLSLRHLADRL